jgi:SSS family transporter
MTIYDYGVIVCYFIFVASLGFIFKKFSSNSSDYFRGGGKMLWWLVGATAFMTQFSAWTFTGAASRAFTDGTYVMVIFFGNALGYFVTYLWSAAKFRQLRVITPMEVIRDRFGKLNEQFFTWLSIPVGIFYAGIWLYAISTFMSVVFQLDLFMTIMIVGCVVLIMATLGGSWAVVASDFMQVMILMPISIVAAFLAIQAVGGGSFLTGASQFLDRLPSNHLDWTEVFRPQIVYLWVFAAILKQICNINNPAESYRFLYSKDSKNAKKAGLLASILFLVGPIIWFIPPMAAAILYPDLNQIPELVPLGDKITDGAYVAIGLVTMPKGMIGLMASAIFAATISSMDSGLNKNAGIFVRNFYRAILRPNASEKELLIVGRLVTLFFGLLVVMAAILINSIQDFGLFDIMMLFSGMVAIPIAVPLILGIIVKKTPKWTGWSTTLVGLITSLVIMYGLNPDIVRDLIGLEEPFSERELKEYLFFAGLIGNILAMTIWFFLTVIFARYNSKKTETMVDDFFKRINTPVVTKAEDTNQMDHAQLRTLSRLCIPYGGFILLLTFIPNSLTGRLCFVFSGLFIIGIGLLLHKAAKKIARKSNESGPGKNEQPAMQETGTEASDEIPEEVGI